MTLENMLEKAKEAGFEKIDDFVKANLHYLPESQQRLFHSLSVTEKPLYEKKDYQDASYGKN